MLPRVPIKPWNTKKLGGQAKLAMKYLKAYSVSKD